jgi:2-isopropylmalate synthase
MAVANSLAAVMAGARQVECTINGLGERAGNAALEEIVMALHTRHDRMPYTTGIKTEHIVKASHLVSTITGFAVQPNKAIVGANAFAHESGIHQDGMLKHAGTYEIMTPESVGLNRSTLVMGKHSGRHAFKAKLRELGFQLGDNALEDAFKRFKDVADKKKNVYDDDIMAGRREARPLLALRRWSAAARAARRWRPELEVDGVRITQRGDAGRRHVQRDQEAVPHDRLLQLYQVHAVTEGTDAQAKVTVRLGEDGKTVNGQGSDTDTLVASARAYIHALNKLLTKREKSAPAALSA